MSEIVYNQLDTSRVNSGFYGNALRSFLEWPEMAGLKNAGMRVDEVLHHWSKKNYNKVLNDPHLAIYTELVLNDLIEQGVLVVADSSKDTHLPRYCWKPNIRQWYLREFKAEPAAMRVRLLIYHSAKAEKSVVESL